MTTQIGRCGWEQSQARYLGIQLGRKMRRSRRKQKPRTATSSFQVAGKRGATADWLTERTNEIMFCFFKHVELEVSPNTNVEQHNAESDTVSSENGLNQG